MFMQVTMECCVGVSTKRVLRLVKFYTVAKKNLKKLTFRTVVLLRSESIHSDEGLQSETSVFYSFLLRCNI